MVLLLHAQLLNLLSDGHLEPGCVCVVPIRPQWAGFFVAQGVVPRRQPGPFSKLREKKTQGFAAATQVVSAGCCRKMVGFNPRSSGPLGLHLQRRSNKKQQMRGKGNKHPDTIKQK